MTEQGDIPIIGKFYAVATHEASGSTATSNILTIKANTISLHFKRYTLAYNNRLKHFTWPPKENPTKYKWEGICEIENYEYRPAPLRIGYLYLCIFNQGKERIFKEFKINIDSSLINIVSDLSKDIREPQSYQSIDYYQIKDDDIVWMAYSEFQWSVPYVRKIRTKDEIRTKRMQKFDAAEWMSNQTAPDAFNEEQIESYFPLDDEDTIPEQMQDGRWTSGFFKDSNNYDYINWWKNKHENALHLDKNEEKKLEVFCCLHDPLGCADELNNDLKSCWDDMNASIIALHSGVDVKEVKNNVINGNKKIDDLILDKKKALQIEGLIKSATMIYKTVYGNKNNCDEYGKEVDKQRLEALLAKEYRKNIKDNIKQARIRLINFLKSDYYRCNCFGKKGDGDSNILHQQQRFYNYLSSVSNPPNTLDSFISLPDENKQYGNSMELKASIKSLCELSELKEKSILDLTDELSGNAKNTTFGLGAFMGIIDGIGDIAAMSVDDFKKIEDNLNAIRTYVGGSQIDKVFEVRSVHVLRIQKYMLFAEDFNRTGAPYVFSGYRADYSTLAYQTDIEVPQITFSDKFINAIRKHKDFFDSFDKLKAKVPWDTLMHKMAILNLAIAGNEVFSASRKNENINKVISSVVGLFSATSGILEQIVKKRGTNAMLKAANPSAAKEIGELFARKAKIFGGVGAILGGIADITNSFTEFNEKDIDTGLLLLGAGMAGIVSGLSTLMAAEIIIAIPLIANPITGTIAFIVVIAFTIWTFFTQDDPLKRHLVNCLFEANLVNGWERLWGVKVSKAMNEINASTNPFLRTCLYYQYRDVLAAEGFEEWSDYTKFYIDTTDLLNCTYVKVNRNQQVFIEQNKNFIVPAYSYYNQVDLEIIIGQYYVDVTKINFHAELYPYGDFKLIDSEPITIVGTPPTIHSQCPFSYILKLNPPKKFIPKNYQDYKYHKAVVLFYYNIDTYGNTKHIVPPSHLTNKDERYVATLIPLCLHTTSQTGIDEANRFTVKKKIGTLKEIKSMNFWKEDYALIYPKVPFEKNNSVITKKE